MTHYLQCNYDLMGKSCFFLKETLKVGVLLLVHVHYCMVNICVFVACKTPFCWIVLCFTIWQITFLTT